MQNCSLTALFFYSLLQDLKTLSHHQWVLEGMCTRKSNLTGCTEFKHTCNYCQPALFRTSPPLPPDGFGSHSPINSIPDNPLFQGWRSFKMYQEPWIYFYMYVITAAPHITAFEPSFSRLWSGSWTYKRAHNSMPYGTRPPLFYFLYILG